jgi:CheY-like chemotaxis protein
MNFSIHDRPIIIVDDDQDDIEFIKEGFEALNIPNETIIFLDALKFLSFMSEATIKPLFILCDINMHAINGLELKKRIWDDERLRLKCIPFLFFSTTGASPAVEKAYSYNAQGFFVKPVTTGRLQEILSAMITYWSLAQRPNL